MRGAERPARRGVLFYVLVCVCCLLAVLCVCLVVSVVLLRAHMDPAPGGPRRVGPASLGRASHLDELMLGDEPPEAGWQDDYRLPADVRPLSYDLLLRPDLEAGTFSGSVAVSLELQAPRSWLALNAKGLAVTATRLTTASGDEVPLADSFEYTPHEFWVARAASRLAPGRYRLRADFSGRLTGKIVGFYRSVYTDPRTGEKRLIATSKFQPTYARQAFPCFDEPSFKSTFNVSLVRPSSGYSALSNMDQVGEVEDSPGPGLTTVQFRTSVPMVTYLTCFIVSDFQRLPPTQVSQGFPFSVYSTPAQVGKTRFAQGLGSQVTEYYIKYFGIPYPLPKLDLIAIPDFVSGAMEHWGLVTFRETVLLYDEAISSTTNKQRVALVVAHELAHMWFGNLMTLDWWSDLWLNEGFATYMEYKGVDSVHPEWRVMDQFLVEELHPVLSLDAALSSHPIVQSVGHPDEITELFDTISYNKGASVIRMLEDFVGEERFRLGLSSFLKKFSFANARTQDMWDALQEVFPEANVTRVMDTWTRQMGLPVVSVERLAPGRLRLAQRRFLADPDADASAQASPFRYRWDIPVSYVTADSKEVKRTWFLSDQDSVTITVPESVAWVKLNHHQHGYYRVNYQPDQWAAFRSALNNNTSALDVPDRANLLDDAFRLANSGLLDYGTALDLSRYLRRETEYVPWAAASSNIAFLRSMLSGTTAYPKLRKYVRHLIHDIYNEVGWEVTPDESHLKKLLRVKVLSLACAYGLPEGLAEAGRRFAAWVSDPGRVGRPPPDLRYIVYQYGMYATSSEVTWDKLWDVFLRETDAQERLKLMSGLASVPEPWLLQRLIEYGKNESYVRSQDFFTLLHFISNNPVGNPIVWEFIRSEWQYLVERFTLNDRYLGRMIPQVCGGFASQFKLQEMEAFFAERPEAGAGAQARRQALEKVAHNIKWHRRHRAAVDEWLSAAVRDLV
ncbi:glutamyl aminopeptidase-like isoform X1 [Bacillus rossius redtenbacheri]|uniref:glutamyl aminopeptidase-like isoform X1 n=1 Tax=Bacillus rossius redtenbacheri TaxID=93214 RepID=UPI002FDCFECF